MWLKIGAWISEAIGLKKVFSVATIVAGVLVISSAAIGWLREDAVNDCNAQWELKLAKANGELKERLAKQEIAFADLQNKLRDVQVAEEASRNENLNLLEKQRETVPLSQACISCRIPNERIWVRRDKGSGASGRSEARPGS